MHGKLPLPTVGDGEVSILIDRHITVFSSFLLVGNNDKNPNFRYLEIFNDVLGRTSYQFPDQLQLWISRTISH